MTRPRWSIELLKKSFASRFILAKLTQIPGLRYVINKLLFEDDILIYIPNDDILKNGWTKNIKIDKKIPQNEDILVPSQIIDKFIEQGKYLWQMNFCLCREANKCLSYSRDKGCLFIGEAVLQIDPSYGKLVTKDEAREYIKQCREEGLIQIIGRNKLNKQWLDVKPGHKLLTICNCCECCCLWKMLPNLDLKISRNITKMPGIKITISEKCIGCGDCQQDICFINAISMKNGKAVINETICRGCGRCINFCKQKAIELTIFNREFLNESLRRISSAVEVD